MGKNQNCPQADGNSIKRRARFAGTAADIAECALFCALMTAAAYIRIPFPFVPLTFQTAVSILCGMLLGVKKGILAMSAYALAGLIGLPVFTSGGGLSYVLLPSFGYILGFIAAAGAGGAVVTRKNSPSLRRCTAAAFAALAANYAIGIAYFIAVWVLSGYSGLFAAVAEYNLIYIPKDILLALLAAVVSFRIIPRICRITRVRRAGSDKR